MYKYIQQPDRSTKPAPQPQFDLEDFYKNWLSMMQKDIPQTASGSKDVTGNEGYLGHEYSSHSEEPGSAGESTGYGPGHQEKDPNKPSGMGGILGSMAFGALGGIAGKAWDANAKAKYAEKLAAHEIATAAELANARERYAAHAAKERTAENEIRDPGGWAEAGGVGYF